MSTSVTIITQNQQMKEIIAFLMKVIDSDSSILLIGETGVGKEVFADYIHYSSVRSGRPFMKIGLSALPGELMESELFGHEKGAFTSAVSGKKGLFELADSGSVFLDDIDDVPIHIQTKLLRVLESKQLMRLGGTVSIPIDTRVISATKTSLKELVKNGNFRSDLYYRLNVVPVEIPALRHRKEDIMLLAEHFCHKFAPQKNLTFSKPVIHALMSYDWPGNVRELRNVIQRITIFAENEVTPEDLPTDLGNITSFENLAKTCTKCSLNGGLSFNDVIHCIEYNLITEALKKTGGNQSEAAKLLNLSLSTFRDKMKKHEMKML